jgi:two-component system response regulator GlrR
MSDYETNKGIGETTTIEMVERVGAGRKILVVDDDLILLKTLGGKLKAHGFTPFYVSDCADALTMVREHNPDAILLDLNFDTGTTFSSLQWEGMSILQWIKRLEGISLIPVFIITIEDPVLHRADALKVGASGFFQKPLDARSLVEEMMKAIRARESRALV